MRAVTAEDLTALERLANELELRAVELERARAANALELRVVELELARAVSVVGVVGIGGVSSRMRSRSFRRVDEQRDHRASTSSTSV